ncbi:MAG: transcription elongation factor GreA [Sulfurimonas sp.]|jgi:transcription elongation factor GreA|nr:transcription elongation factor GreA [Sulfurimonadaceae bacterium]
MQKIEPMTLFGYEKLQSELKELKDVKRPQTLRELESARELGDLKENAEYHAAKEMLANIDMRLNELGELFACSKLVDPKELNHTRVCFGSTIVLNDVEMDVEVCYTIVGGCESNPDKGLISYNSPLAKQLLGKEEGDEVKIKLPAGLKEYEVVEVCYKEICF